MNKSSVPLLAKNGSSVNSAKKDRDEQWASVGSTYQPPQLAPFKPPKMAPFQTTVAPAVNQGIQIASGKQILLLNNDTVVTTGWLEGLLESLYDRPDTGLVGPVSNNVSGPQKIAVTYSELSSLDGFAWDLRLNRQLMETDRLVGFCILLRRSVIDDIGLFDERFRFGGFEDDDLRRRAIDAGYKVLIASHVFVHHFRSVTFKATGIDLGAIMDQNPRRFKEKWSNESKNRD